MHKTSSKLIALGAVLIFFFSCMVVAISSQDFVYSLIVSVDHSIDTFIAPLRTIPVLAKLMLVFTYLGNPEIIIALELCLLAFILVIKRKRIAALFLGSIILGELVSYFFKVLLERSRPEELFFHVSRHGYSFPSGHALLATVFYGCLGFFAAHLAKTDRQKISIAIGTAVIVFLIGFSRIFLGVHWASDVLGGWVLGGAVLAFTTAVFFRIHKHKKGDHLTELTRKERIGLIAVAFMVGFFVVFYFVTHLTEIRSIV